MALFNVYPYDFRNISTVVRVSSEKLCRNSVIRQKSAFLHIVGIKLAAYEHKFSLFNANSSL